MAIDSTAELLFKINADSGGATDAMEKFRALTAEEIAQVRELVDGFVASAAEGQETLAAALDKTTGAEQRQTAATEELAAAHGHAVSEIQATSGAIRLLEGSGGIRAMERFTATTLGLGPALQAIFPVVGALAFIEIIARMGEKVFELYKKWDPVSQAEKRALDTAKEYDGVIKSIGEELRKFQDESFANAFGVIAGKINESTEIVKRNVDADKVFIAGLQQQIEATKKIVAEGTFTHQLFPTVTREAQAAKKDLESLQKQLLAYELDLQANEERSSALINEANKARIDLNTKNAKSAAKAKEEFYGLSSVLESIKSKIAGTGTEWDRLLNEVSHYREEISKAERELEKLEKAGTITAQSARRESQALAQLPAMIGTMMADVRAKLDQEAEKAYWELIEKQVIAQEQRDEMLVNLHRSLLDRLATYDAQDYARKRAQVNKEIDDLTEEYSKKGAAEKENMDLLDQIRSAGLARIDAEQNAAFASEIQKLQGHLTTMWAAQLVGADKLAAVYAKDLEKWDATEEAKALKTADTQDKIDALHQKYAAARDAITAKYQNDLQTLLNSQGWQGVFGDKFASMIKGNQQLMQQWSQSTNQSLLLVKVSLQGIRDMSQQAFGDLAQGLANSAAQALVQGKSFTQAMEQMLKSTLESIAAQAFTWAIYSTAMGIFDLAIMNYPGAAQAFSAAALWGTIGGATAAIGSAIPSGGASAVTGSGGGSASRPSGSPSGVAGSIAGGSQQQAGPNVQVIVQGHVIGPSGAAQLCDIITQAVYNNNASLYASHNAQGTPLP